MFYKRLLASKLFRRLLLWSVLIIVGLYFGTYAVLFAVSEWQESRPFGPIPTVAYSPDAVSAYAPSDADFFYPADRGSSSKQLQVYISAIERRIEQLREMGDQQSASDIEAELQSVMERDLSLPYPAPQGEERLHAVGIYEGNDLGIAGINVTDTSGPVVLAISSYDPVNWQISKATGVELKRVIVGRPSQSTVSGLPASVPIEGNVNGRQDQECHFGVGHSPEDLRYAAPTLRKVTGLELSTWQGEYRFERKSFEVGPGSAAWSSQRRVKMLSPLYQEATATDVRALAAELSKISFPMVHYGRVMSNGYYDWRPFFAQASIFGAYKETCKALQKRYRVGPLVYWPNGPAFFAIDHGRLVAIDPHDGSVTNVHFPYLRDIGHGPLLALDDDNDRLYLWGWGKLKSIDLNTKQITMHRGGCHGIHGLVYSKASKCLYAVCTPNDSSSDDYLSRLKKYNLRGAEIGVVDLSIPIYIRHGEIISLAELSDKLVLIPQLPMDIQGKPLPGCNYIIEPATGEVVFVCRRSPR